MYFVDFGMPTLNNAFCLFFAGFDIVQMRCSILEYRCAYRVVALLQLFYFRQISGKEQIHFHIKHGA